MEIKVFAGTKLGHVPTKEEFDKIGGLTAGVCYLPDTIAKLFSEADENTKKRESRIKDSGHKSPFDHPTVNLELVDIPKILAMILNNESMYTTSEKSARYRRMALPDDENKAYEKWLPIFAQEIENYRNSHKGSEKWLTESKIGKLAQENARYLTSVFTPTSMVYSLSYRQLNVIYSKISREIDFLAGKQDIFSKKLRDSLVEFASKLESLGYIDEKLALNDKNLALKLFNRTGRQIKEQFGECYTITYKGSFAQLAQAQRHRTLDYAILAEKNGQYFEDVLANDSDDDFYLPPILKGSKYQAQWLADCKALAEKFPQGMLVPVLERGTIENFILKSKERNCTAAQLEIDNQTTASKKKIYSRLSEADPELAAEIKPYMAGSRCTYPDFECPSPCAFAEGVKGERII